MATKKDLIEAQGFSRRRLLSAFTSGAPGGKELEPAKPLRAVVAGIALTAVVVIVGIFYGLIRPGLPSGWENNSLILVNDTGARYVAIDGVLYPVINTASARLLIPADEFRVVTTDRSTIENIEIGSTIGILGAPDDLPSPDSLIPSGWGACIAGDETSVTLSPSASATAAAGGMVATLEGDLFVVTGGERYAVDAASADSVLRAVGLDTAEQTPVDGRWLNLFTAGETLEPITVLGAGQDVAGTGFVVGEVVHPVGSDESERYLLTADGELAPLSPLAYQLYLLGTGAELGPATDVSPADLATLSTAPDAAGDADWPDAAITELDGDPCAVLEHDADGTPRTTLALATSVEAPAPGVSVAVGGGALVRAAGQGEQTSGMIFLIDESGTAFAIPDATEDTIARLGYALDDVSRVPDRWLQFLPTGPALTAEAAASSPESTPAESP